MYSDVERYVCQRIADTPIVEEPFPHQIVTDVFPAAYYEELLDALPSSETYRPIGESGTVSPNAYAERYVCALYDLAAEEMESDRSTFWRDLTAWLMHGRFRDFLVNRYAKHMTERFGVSADVRSAIDARFVRDRTNFAIGPHTDMGHKLLSLLFYLPRDQKLRHLGTSIYQPNDPAFRCEGGPHYPSKNFRLVQTAPYVPNTLFVFFRTGRSFHGVEPVRDKNVERNLLLYNVFAKEMTQQKPSGLRLPWQSRASR